MKITQEQKEILEAGAFEGNIYKLPDIQLDRKMYKLINDILNTLGGKWKTRVGHIFNGEQEDLENALKEVLEKGETETLSEIKKKFQFFPTPKEIAERLVELADIKENDIVLEPSAGQGAISDEILKKEPLRLRLIELQEENYMILGKKYEGQYNILITNNDFLELGDDVFYSKIIANPPFSKNQDVKHILKMYSVLKTGGTIVVIAPSHLLEKTTKLHQKLLETGIEKIEDIGAGGFKQSGTMINTAIYKIIK